MNNKEIETFLSFPKISRFDLVWNVLTNNSIQVELVMKSRHTINTDRGEKRKRQKRRQRETEEKKGRNPRVKKVREETFFTPISVVFVSVGFTKSKILPLKVSNFLQPPIQLLHYLVDQSNKIK